LRGEAALGALTDRPKNIAPAERPFVGKLRRSRGLNRFAVNPDVLEPRGCRS